jgi:tetratricopeptide (TPR) repeat protein
MRHPLHSNLWSRAGRIRCALLLITACASAPGAMAQSGGRDYYNPGTGTDDRAIFEQVHSYHLQPGIEKMTKGTTDRGYGDFLFILQGFPNSPQALNLMSELCVNKMKSAKCDADPFFERAVAINPKIATTYVLYGIHLQRKGKHTEAIEKFNQALALQPNSVNAHYNMGLIYVDLKQYELANRHAQVAYALGAQLPGLHDKLVKVGKWQPLPELSAKAPANDAVPKVDDPAPAAPAKN